MTQKKKKKAPLSRCASDFRESWDDIAWCTVQFSKTIYFCAELEVTHNPKLHEFNDSTFTQKDLIHLCTQIGGGGICCKFPNGSERLFKFNEFVKNTATIQFWALWSKDIRRITILKECLGDMTDFCRKEATVRRYLQEFHGDALYTFQICAVYDRIKTSNVSLVQSQLIN